MALNLDHALGVHAQALTLRAQRAQQIATNIANAETPNYLAKDLDFRAALSQAQNQRQTGTLATTHAGHLQPTTGIRGALQYRVSNQPTVDGNTVDEHQEKAAFADNTLRYQATLRFLNGRIGGLMSALKGQ